MSNEDRVKELVVQLAEASFERGLRTLEDFYEGLENIPAELLCKQWAFEMNFAEYLVSLNPDLALIDRSGKMPQALENYGELSPIDVEVKTRYSFVSSGWKHVIPLAEAIKEMEDGHERS